MLNYQDIKLLIVHCSDTEDNDINAEYIHKMHLEFGWDGIGYHKVILRSGKIENDLEIPRFEKSKVIISSKINSFQ